MSAVRHPLPHDDWEFRDRHSDVHVLPLNDLREHDETRTCWCRPQLTQEPFASVVVTHNSADGRELVEQHGVS